MKRKKEKKEFFYSEYLEYFKYAVLYEAFETSFIITKEKLLFKLVIVFLFMIFDD